jgi:hypothetical protein
MKRPVAWITLGGLIVSLLLGVWVLPRGRSGTITEARAAEKDNAACSVATLNGAYGFYRTGTTSVGPLASVGIATYDGNGTTTVRQTIRKNGVTTQDLFTGPTQVASYEVDPDCAGRLLNPDGSAFSHFVVVDRGKEFFGLSLSPGNSVNVVWKKITISKED